MQSCKSSYNLVKIKNHSREQWCHNYKKIGGVRIGTFPILWTLVKTRLSQSPAEGEEHTNLNACSCALLFS